MMESNYINVEQVRKAPAAPWTFEETEQGWMARFGSRTLICVNAKKVRYFKSLDRAVRKLGDEVGVRKFEVEILGS